MNLSERQLECIMHLANGLTMAEIGKTLYISEGSVKQSLASARKKIGAVNNANLVSLAVAKNFIFWSDDEDARTLDKEKEPPQSDDSDSKLHFLDFDCGDCECISECIRQKKCCKLSMLY